MGEEVWGKGVRGVGVCVGGGGVQGEAVCWGEGDDTETPPNHELPGRHVSQHTPRCVYLVGWDASPPYQAV